VTARCRAWAGSACVAPTGAPGTARNGYSGPFRTGVGWRHALCADRGHPRSDPRRDRAPVPGHRHDHALSLVPYRLGLRVEDFDLKTLRIMVHRHHQPSSHRREYPSLPLPALLTYTIEQVTAHHLASRVDKRHYGRFPRHCANVLGELYWHQRCWLTGCSTIWGWAAAVAGGTDPRSWPRRPQQARGASVPGLRAKARRQDGGRACAAKNIGDVTLLRPPLSILRSSRPALAPHRSAEPSGRESQSRPSY
jgi:hypothetical protein